jgi:hypothetical protein
MNFKNIAVAVGLVALTANANAALLGVVQTFPDVTLGTNYVIYDHNGVDANTGLLRIVSRSSTLSKAPGAGNSTPAQLYNSASDTIPDSMLTVAVNNSTGAFVANNAVNKLTIGFGNTATVGNSSYNASAFGFKWLGDVTNFGFLVTQTGSSYQLSFDGRVNITTTDYSNMPAGFESFVDGAHAVNNGGFKLNIATSTSSGSNGGVVSGWSAANDGRNIFASSWIYGTSVRTGASAVNTAFFNTTNGQLNPFLAGTGITASSSNTFNGTVAADVFAPVPAAAWLLVSAVAGLGTLGRRRAI